MREVTRRSFLATAVAIPASVCFAQLAEAQSSQQFVRYDVRSQRGLEMVKIYADAVSLMKKKNEDDPIGWVFQWYTHWVKGDGSEAKKQAELNRIYPQPNDKRKLASSMWNTCQPHGPGMDGNLFLPWHRMLLYYIEQIIRSVTSEATFTLPYWNYSVADSQLHGILPEEFRLPGHAVFDSLYRKNRNKGVNEGKSIDATHPDLLNPTSLALCQYESEFPVPGFCDDLNGKLHGHVHVQVGDVTNMGVVPWAANDPIFWLHHCNIDRLWASWNHAGRTNPNIAGSFTFADQNGKGVTAQVADFMDLAKVGYVYDKLEDVPECPKQNMMLAGNETPKKISEVKATPINLGSEPVQVTLDPVPEHANDESWSLGARAGELAQPHALYLVVKDMRTNAQPGVVYDIYLDLPRKPSDEQLRSHHVGTFNFFEAGAHDGREHGEQTKANDKRFISFDITALAKTLHKRNLLNRKPTLTIIPADKPSADAKPVVGEISIIEK